MAKRAAGRTILSNSRMLPSSKHCLPLFTSLSLSLIDFQVLLEGEKEVVWWPYAQRSALSRSRITTEDNDEMYMAEGIHRR